MTTLSRHLRERHPTDPAPSWAYHFSNGYSASVIVDPSPDRPFRFEVWSDDPADNDRGGVVAGLTSEQAEAKLHAIAALPTFPDTDSGSTR